MTPQTLKTPYKPLVKWRDMESTILGKRPAEDLPPAGRMPPPPEARTVDSNSDSEDEFDDGADWLDGPAALSESSGKHQLPYFAYFPLNCPKRDK